MKESGVNGVKVGQLHTLAQNEGEKRLQILDVRARDILKILEDDPRVCDAEEMKKHFAAMEKEMVNQKITQIADWLDIDPAGALDNPLFFYCLAKIYQGRRMRH